MVLLDEKHILGLAQKSDDVESLKSALTNYLANNVERNVSHIVHSKTGDGLLHILARLGHVACIDLLINEFGVFVDQKNMEGKTALHEAAQYSQSVPLKRLITHGSEIDCLKRADWSPLMLACTKIGNVDCVSALLEAGADVTLRNKDGWTAFHVCVRTGDMDMVTYILTKDEKAWDTSSNNKRTPLHTAALAGHCSLVSLLLSLGCSPALPDSCGVTPLMDSVRGDHTVLLERMLSVMDSSVQLSRDAMGRALVHVAAEAGATSVLQYLKKSHPYLLASQQLTNAGLTPLHSAAREGHCGAVSFLLCLPCAQIDALDGKGRTPLFLAVNGQHSHVAKLLLDTGAKLSIRDLDGLSPKDVARKPDVISIISIYDK